MCNYVHFATIPTMLYRHTILLHYTILLHCTILIHYIILLHCTILLHYTILLTALYCYSTLYIRTTTLQHMLYSTPPSPMCCRCKKGGMTSRWHHISAGEHYCNECFDWIYRG